MIFVSALALLAVPELKAQLPFGDGEDERPLDSELRPGAPQPKTEVPDFDEPRVFTASNGQSVTGNVKVVEVNQVVEITPEGGGSIKARLGDLTKDDQDYIKAWYLHEVLIKGKQIQITAERGTGDGNLISERYQVTKPAGSRESQVGFKLKIRSVAALPIEEPVVKYQILKKYDSGQVAAYEVSTTLPELLKETKEVVTRSVNVVRFSGSSETVGLIRYITPPIKEQVVGVWVRVYSKDELIGEAAEPAGIMQNYRWADGIDVDSRSASGSGRGQGAPMRPPVP